VGIGEKLRSLDQRVVKATPDRHQWAWALFAGIYIPLAAAGVVLIVTGHAGDGWGVLVIAGWGLLFAGLRRGS